MSLETWFLANHKLLFQAREGILEPKNQVSIPVTG
jgi:hypothetical protein